MNVQTIEKINLFSQKEKILAGIKQKPYFSEGDFVLYNADSLNLLKELPENSIDMIFADPPYDESLAIETLKWLERGDVLAESGIVVLQHSMRETPEGLQIRAMVVTDQRRYGDTMLSFLTKKTG